MQAARVVVADDDVLLREGLASLLIQSGYDVVGQAADGDELLELVSRHDPQLAVIDIRMPPTGTTEGLEAAETLRASRPQLGILLLSAHVEVETAMSLLNGGDRIGYLLKSRVRRVEDFLDALERIQRGGAVIDPALIEELVGRQRHDDPLQALSRRELEVLALMAEGRSNAGIAKRLFVRSGGCTIHQMQ